ncbi:MAG: CPBP family intramembrane metalloprotease [Firmicutes bacterium]|nr:CPBP family intramembrane metalloprotease [Bacillota bacterium]
MAHTDRASSLPSRRLVVALTIAQAALMVACGMLAIWLVRRGGTGAYVARLFVWPQSAWEGGEGLLVGGLLAVLMSATLDKLHVAIPDTVRTLLQLLRPRAAYTLLASAGLYEEFAFRGALQGLLSPAIGVAWAAIAAVTLFTVLHVPQYRGNYVLIAEVLALAVVTSGWYGLTGNLVGPICVHAAFNFVLARRQHDALFHEPDVNAQGASDG